MTAPEPESANAPATAVLVCNTPTCSHRGSFVQIHADTVLPALCGGCQAVLHCDHQHETRVIPPSLTEPLHHTVTACTICGTEAKRETRDATAAELAALLPAGLRAALKTL